LHRSAAAILCELYAADLDAHVAEIAHHFFEGAPLGAWEPAVEYAARAGRRAMDMFAFDVAAHHFERGLAALEGGSLTDPDRRAELQWRLGVARARLGDMAAARVHCEYAAEVARQAGRPDLFADAVLALGAELVPGMIDVRLIDMLEAALQPTLVDPARRALVMARLAAAMTPTLARDRPLQLARSALATARTLGDPRTLAQVVAIARSVLTPADPLDERIALDDELARLARALGDRLLESQAHGRLSLDAIEHGDPAMVDRELVLHRRLVEQLRSPRLQLRAARIRLLWATLTERDDELSAAQAEVRILADQLDDPGGRASLIVNQVFRRWLACELDDDSAARTLLEQLGSAQLARLVPRDLAIAAAGRVELDGPRIATVRQVLRALGPASAVLMMPAVLATGDPALLGAIYDGMLPYAASNPVHMAALASAGPASYHLALLARSRGDREQAAAHFAEALAASTRSGFPGYARRCQRELEAVPQHATTAAVASPLALPSATPLPDPPPTLVQDGETWLLTHGARRVRLKSTKGVCYLAALLDKPGRDLFVGDLIRLGHHPPGAGELEAGSALREAATVAGLGGAGEMLDAKARQAYRQRLDQLSDALEDAEARSDRDAVERLEHERSMLGRELARAVGLGGRGRRAGDPSERARINVQRRLRDVLDRVLQLDPVLGRHLDLHVKTGTFCTWKA
jgi:tetratricopeptide (TPR) repeat protein